MLQCLHFKTLLATALPQDGHRLGAVNKLLPQLQQYNARFGLVCVQYLQTIDSLLLLEIRADVTNDASKTQY